MKYLGWFSCGVTSAVACKLAIEKFGDDVELWYIETGAAHPDNIRFIKDCENGTGEKYKRPEMKNTRLHWMWLPSKYLTRLTVRHAHMS